MAEHPRQVLGALRYATAEDSATYLAIMGLFTSGMGGFLSDQSADDIADRLRGQGLDLDRDTVDARLSYLVEHGNLARSPRETEARSVREYLSNRARYQLTPRGELVQRQVEELLHQADGAREVSSEMLPGILRGIEWLRQACERDLTTADPTDLAARIATLFAQFELLVTSTRQFYSYLTQVLARFDLDRDEFVVFKTALLDYLQRFVDEIARVMPQLAEQLRALSPHVPALCARADAGERLVAVDGSRARRAPGLEPQDWDSLHAWFVGSPGRRADADNVRLLATEAMRSLVTNLRRIAAGADRERSRYTDLTRLARWFDDGSDDDAHALWSVVFGLGGARHLSFAADPEGDPLPGTTSWWAAPAAEVPVLLRTHGERKSLGRTSARVDYSLAKLAALTRREEQERARSAAVAELASCSGPLDRVEVSDAARAVLLDAYASTLVAHGRPLGQGLVARGLHRAGGRTIELAVCAQAGHDVVVAGPSGTLTLRGLAIELAVVP